MNSRYHLNSEHYLNNSECEKQKKILVTFSKQKKTPMPGGPSNATVNLQNGRYGRTHLGYTWSIR